MANEQKPTQEKSLEAKVCEWLSTEGYRIEYLTYKALSDVGLITTMSSFLDSAEGKQREIDVTGWYRVPNDAISVRIFCECKYSKNPWVLLYSDTQAEFTTDWHALPQSRSVERLFPFIKREAKPLSQLWHFAPHLSFAHSIRALHEKKDKEKKDNRDFAYASLQKIANAAWDFCEINEKEFPESFSVVIPCIVVDAPLLAATFNFQKAQFEAMQIPFGRLSWSGCRQGTNVDVVHLASIDEYAAKVRDTVHMVGEAIWASRAASVDPGVI